MNPDKDTPVTLHLTLEKVNMILGALGNLPFVQSAEIIGEVRQQAITAIEKLQPPRMPHPGVEPSAPPVE